MKTDKYELWKCFSTDSVVDVMKKINKNAYGMLYVVDEEDILIGSITDGDIRRWIIKGGALKAPVEKVMNNSPRWVTDKNRLDGKRIMYENRISSVAVIDDTRHIIDIIVSRPKKEYDKDSLYSTPVIIMAGGKGTRLHPYTKILPKPLIPIGEIPILERIMNRFAEFGVSEFYLTVNYRKEMIKSYFSETDHNYIIHYIEENEPLGTAGGIRLIDSRFDNPVIVTNCDILIEADYGDILKYHNKSGNELTIVSSLKNTVIPYGVLYAGENGIVSDMQEKPEFSNFINTGMYIMNPDYINWIPEGEMFHMTQLASMMIQKGKHVGMYPISENSFLDMGEFAEMKRMEDRINAGFIYK